MTTVLQEVLGAEKLLQLMDRMQAIQRELPVLKKAFEDAQHELKMAETRLATMRSEFTRQVAATGHVDFLVIEQWKLNH